jgi:hypothetical protein
MSESKVERNEREKIEIEAGCKMNEAFIGFIQHRIHSDGLKLTKEDQNQIERDMIERVLPSSFCNVSSARLREMLIDDYLKEASILLVKNYKLREVTFYIPNKDSDVLPELLENWKNNGYHTEVVKEEIRTKIVITW